LLDDICLECRSNPDLTALRKNGASTESCTPLSAVPGRCIAHYALPAWSRRKDLHLQISCCRDLVVCCDPRSERPDLR